ncbi:MAG TPA: hypothetical protein P5081_23485, partial [Phycisphaerae bacterium]|nr:hypothetical protein [Phycisphaerae bacterium]
MKRVRANRSVSVIAMAPLCAGFFTVATARASVSFEPIGMLPTGEYSLVGGISPDGNVVVGQSEQFEPSVGATVPRAVRWQAGTLTSLGFVNFAPIASMGFDASLDGSVIVGREVNPVGMGSAPLAWRWEAGVMTQLPFLPGGDASNAYA